MLGVAQGLLRPFSLARRFPPRRRVVPAPPGHEPLVGSHHVEGDHALAYVGTKLGGESNRQPQVLHGAAHADAHRPFASRRGRVARTGKRRGFRGRGVAVLDEGGRGARGSGIAARSVFRMGRIERLLRDGLDQIGVPSAAISIACHGGAFAELFRDQQEAVQGGFERPHRTLGDARVLVFDADIERVGVARGSHQSQRIALGVFWLARQNDGALKIRRRNAPCRIARGNQHLVQTRLFEPPRQTACKGRRAHDRIAFGAPHLTHDGT